MRNHRTVQRGLEAPSPDSSTPTRFDQRLIRGLSDEELEEFAARWKTGAVVREAVVKCLTKDLEHAILLSESEETFKSPHPLAILSDLTGYRRGLRAAIKLLTNQDPK